MYNNSYQSTSDEQSIVKKNKGYPFLEFQVTIGAVTYSS